MLDWVSDIKRRSNLKIAGHGLITASAGIFPALERHPYIGHVEVAKVSIQPVGLTDHVQHIRWKIQARRLRGALVGFLVRRSKRDACDLSYLVRQFELGPRGVSAIRE